MWYLKKDDKRCLRCRLKGKGRTFSIRMMRMALPTGVILHHQRTYDGGRHCHHDGCLHGGYPLGGCLHDVSLHDVSPHVCCAFPHRKPFARSFRTACARFFPLACRLRCVACVCFPCGSCPHASALTNGSGKSVCRLLRHRHCLLRSTLQSCAA